MNEISNITGSFFLEVKERVFIRLRGHPSRGPRLSAPVNSLPLHFPSWSSNLLFQAPFCPGSDLLEGRRWYKKSVGISQHTGRVVQNSELKIKTKQSFSNHPGCCTCAYLLMIQTTICVSLLCKCPTLHMCPSASQSAPGYMGGLSADALSGP